MNYRVITISNRRPSEPYYFPDKFHESLRRFGTQAVVLGMDQPWGGLMTKPRTLRKWLRNEAGGIDCVIVVDCWDLVFAAPPEAIVSQWKASGRPWLIGAERALFPPGDESRYPAVSSSYRFPNSGFIISTPADMLRALDHMNLDSIPDDHQSPDGAQVNPNDQEFYQKVFLDQPIPMRLDWPTNFVWNLCNVGLPSLSFKEGKIFNEETGNSPMVFHFNGGSKQGPAKDAIFSHLSL